MKKFISIIGIFFVLQSCSSPEVKVEVKRQRMIYDSINFKVEGFNVNLYSTLEFSKKNLERKDYDDFLLVIEQDTFALVPEINKLKFNNSKPLEIEYLSYINFESKTYDNDSLLKFIKRKSKIINSKGEIVTVNKGFNIESYIALHNTNSNIKTE